MPDLRGGGPPGRVVELSEAVDNGDDSGVTERTVAQQIVVLSDEDGKLVRLSKVESLLESILRELRAIRNDR